MKTLIDAYCSRIAVPELDEAAITARIHRTRILAPRGAQTGRLIAAIAIVAIFILGLCNISAVTASVNFGLRAFRFEGTHVKPLFQRHVDLVRLRADLPFTIIEPPAVAKAPNITIDETLGEGPSAIFEMRGTRPNENVTIIESDAARPIPKTLFAIHDGASLAKPLPLSVGLNHEEPAPRQILLRGLFAGKLFMPETWVVRGTRIVLTAPPGFLSAKSLETIRRSMSM